MIDDPSKHMKSSDTKAVLVQKKTANETAMPDE